MVFMTIVLIWMYPWVHKQFFPNLVEAEIQMYFLGIGLVVGFLSLLYWISYHIRAVPFQTLRLPSMLRRWPIAVSIISGVALLVLFENIIFPNPTFHEHLKEMNMDLIVFNPLLYGLLVIGYFLFFIRQGVVKRVLPRAFPQEHPQGDPFLGVPQPASPVLLFIEHLSILLVIVLLSFHVGYLSIYDHTHYAGPINDVLHGRPLLTFFSWYGFLSIATLSLLFKVIPLSLLNLTIVTAFAVTIGFIAVYIISYLLTRRASLAFLTTLFAIFANWIVQSGLRNTIPQATVLRFGMWIPLTFMIYKESVTSNAHRKKFWRFLVECMVVFSFFWTFDIGIYVVGGYLLFRWLSSLRSNLPETYKIFLPYLVRIVVFLLITALSIQLYYTYVLGVTPQWQYFTGGPVLFLQSFLLIPAPYSFIPWLVLAPAGVTIGYLVTKHRFDRDFTSVDSTLMFIASYATLQFAYFMGRSSLGNLHTILIPNAICLFALIDRAIHTSMNHQQKVSLILLISFLLAFPSYFLFFQGVANLKQENIITTIQTLDDPKGTEQEFFGDTTTLIQERYGNYINHNGIAVLSAFDTWYLVLLGKTNQLGSNCLFCYIAPPTVDPLISSITQKKFRYLFVDTDKTLHYGQVSWIFGAVKNQYKLKETLGRLDVYERVD